MDSSLLPNTRSPCSSPKLTRRKWLVSNCNRSSLLRLPKYRLQIFGLLLRYNGCFYKATSSMLVLECSPQTGLSQAPTAVAGSSYCYRSNKLAKLCRKQSESGRAVAAGFSDVTSCTVHHSTAHTRGLPLERRSAAPPCCLSVPLVAGT